jgi:Domain of unknown function (DUF1707)
VTDEPARGLRASDEEREQAADNLRKHCATGRLSLGELEARVASAYAAKTRAELADLLGDLPQTSWLPDGRRERRRRVTPPRVGRPGTRRFFQRHEFEADAEELFERSLSRIVPEMVTSGYRVTQQEASARLVFEMEEVSFLGMTARRGSRIELLFVDFALGARLTVEGAASRTVRQAFARLSD